LFFLCNMELIIIYVLKTRQNFLPGYAKTRTPLPTIAFIYVICESTNALQCAWISSWCNSLKYLFSSYKLPHSRNVHSYRPCPLLQRTIPTTSSNLNPRQQKRQRGRKGKLHQYQISNIISFLYYYLLFSVHVNDNSTYHSSHSHVTLLPSAPCLNNISHYSNIVIMILPLYICLSNPE